MEIFVKLTILIWENRNGEQKNGNVVQIRKRLTRGIMVKADVLQGSQCD